MRYFKCFHILATLALVVLFRGVGLDLPQNEYSMEKQFIHPLPPAFAQELGEEKTGASFVTWPPGPPGGGRIAFTSNRDGNSEIYVMNADGSGVTRLTNNPAGDTQPVWSPDGKRIAFSSNRDGNEKIYVMNADGFGVTRLTNSPGNEGWPAWSPDGQRIAFEYFYHLDSDIYIVNADGSGLTNLTNSPERSEVSLTWSPGQRIAFASVAPDDYLEIYTMNADGSDLTRLTNHPEADDCPAWSPDGQRIAFASDRDGNYEIYVMNADGSGVTRLTNNPAGNWWSCWSPDGRHIAFESDRDGSYEIWVMNADGSDVMRLVTILSETVVFFNPTWSPDSQRLAFMYKHDGNREIYVINADGSGLTNLTNNPAGDAFPAWSPVDIPGLVTAPAQGCTSDATFVADVTVPDNTVFSPGAPINKVWRLKNNGDCTWGEGYVLAFLKGEQMGGPAFQPLESAVAPGDTVDIGLTMYAPEAPGTYTGWWRMRDPAGSFFGPEVFVKIIVEATTSLSIGEIESQDATVYYNRGCDYAERGDHEQAIAAFTQAITLRPDYAKAYYNRGNSYAALGQDERAIEDYTRALTIGVPNPHWAYYNRGNSYLALGDGERAIEDYSQAIALKTDYIKAYITRGVAYSTLGNYKQAIADYDQAIAFTPDDFEAFIIYFNRGNAYFALSNYEQAVADYTQAISLRPDYAEAYNNRGNAYDKLGDHERAIADYDRAIELKPDYAEAYNNRGFAYDEIGDYERAIADLETYLKLAPNASDRDQVEEKIVALKKQRSVSMLDTTLTVSPITPPSAEAEFVLTPTPTKAPPPRFTPTGAKILLADDFSDPNSGWNVSSGKEIEMRYEAGEYSILVKAPNILAWDTAGETFEDFALEVDVRQIAGSADSTYGVLYRYQDKNNFYSFQIDGNGYYSVAKQQNGIWMSLVDWTEVPSIARAETTNHLKVVCKGPRMSFYLNDIQLSDIQEGSFTKGDIGLVVGTYAEPYVQVHFDNLEVQAAKVAMAITRTPPTSTPTPTPIAILLTRALDSWREDVQGHDNWYYLSYINGTYEELPWDSDDDWWQWYYPRDPRTDYIRLHRTGGHPGCFESGSPAVDVARMWVSPVSGPIRIRGNVHKEDCGGDGVIAKIYKNSRLLWEQSLWGCDMTGKDFWLETTVVEGDRLYFRLNLNGRPEHDRTYFDPSIYLLKMPTPQPEARVETPTRVLYSGARPTSTPTPTSTLIPRPKPTLKPSVDFKIIKQEILPKDKNKCENLPEIQVWVLDKDGNPLNNIRVEASYYPGQPPIELNSGWQAPGYNKATGAGLWTVKVTRDVPPFGDRVYTSEESRPLDTSSPSWEDLIAGGYCHDGDCIPCANYSYEVVFQKQW